MEFAQKTGFVLKLKSSGTEMVCLHSKTYFTIKEHDDTFEDLIFSLVSLLIQSSKLTSLQLSLVLV